MALSTPAHAVPVTMFWRALCLAQAQACVAEAAHADGVSAEAQCAISAGCAVLAARALDLSRAIDPASSVYGHAGPVRGGESHTRAIAALLASVTVPTDATSGGSTGAATTTTAAAASGGAVSTPGKWHRTRLWLELHLVHHLCHAHTLRAAADLAAHDAGSGIGRLTAVAAVLSSAATAELLRTSRGAVPGAAAVATRLAAQAAEIPQTLQLAERENRTVHLQETVHVSRAASLVGRIMVRETPVLPHLTAAAAAASAATLRGFVPFAVQQAVAVAVAVAEARAAECGAAVKSAVTQWRRTVAECALHQIGADTDAGGNPGQRE
jgi:hypothetical protein